MDKMTSEQMALSLNEWMRRYIEDPASFSAEFQAVSNYLADKESGIEPSYGAISAEYMFRLYKELIS